MTFNNFVLDPQHLQPSSTTPAAINDTLPTFPNLALNPLMMANGGAGGMNAGFSSNLGVGGMGFNMMQQQMMMMMQMQQAMMMGQAGVGVDMGGMGGGNLANRLGGFASGGAGNGMRQDIDAPPGANGANGAAGPGSGTQDPRARRGRVSYEDLDAPGGEGDGGLPY